MNKNKTMFTRGYNKPSFCFITPTAYLEHYATQSTIHLVLAHLVDSDERYTNFYKQQSDIGNRIIMDCSTFELGESYPPERLIELGKKCGANAIVLPDYPFKHFEVTIRAAEKWIPEVKSAGFSTFYVPQSETNDKEGWIRGYEWGVGNPDIDIIGMSILGIPNALPHIPAAYARVVMTEILHDRKIFNYDKYHHYLGLNSGVALEIPSLLQMNALDSIDSSGPVWCGINGIRYDITTDSYMPLSKKYLREVDFNTPFIKKMHIHEVIQNNVTLTQKLFGDYDVQVD